MVLVVERCKAISLSSPIHNVWVDAENVKWVANKEGLFKVMALDLAQPVPVGSGTTHLLNIRGGNGQIEWSTSVMQQALGSAKPYCAFYDKKSETIWIGTQDGGAFQFNADPFSLKQQLNTSNKKLPSNQVNDIHVDSKGTIWIATNDGMVTGNGDRWSTQERYLNFVAVDAFGDNFWILGDNFLWRVDSRGKWNPIAIEPKNVEGPLRDIAVDGKGRVWIASNMMTGYNVESAIYQRFGPGQYFTSQFVNCIDVDQDNSIWTGTDDKGLYLIQWEDAMTINVMMATPPDCKSNAPTGVLTTHITGGQTPFQYAWSNGQTTADAKNLAPGEYEVTVTDAKGVKKTKKYEIPPSGVQLTIEVVSNSSGGNDGKANAIPNGGTGNLKYNWDNGEKTQLASTLNPGKHSVTVTDESGCSAIASVDVKEDVTAMSVTIDIVNDILCASSVDGALSAKVNGGKTPYTYMWSHQQNKSTNLENLPTGNYSVTVTDASGQTANAQASLKNPVALLASIQIETPASANLSNGVAKAMASGGLPPYQYKWGNGESTAQVKNMSAGTTTLVVTDANGCSTSASVVMTENIGAMTVSVNETQKLKCNDDKSGAIAVTVSGGKSPYTYVWNNGSKETSLSNLASGSYTVTITDAAGNQKNQSFELKAPNPIKIYVQADGISSPGGSDGKASVKAEGGTGKLSYSWDNGEKSDRASKLNAGKHTVTVSDENGCSITADIEINETILALKLEISESKKLACADTKDAELSSQISGGKKPYSYAWSQGGTGEKITGLSAGSYSLVVTDAVGKTITNSFTILAPDALHVNVVSDAPAKLDEATGSAVANVNGGTKPFSYQWDNGESTEKALRLNAGSHSVTVTDANGCQATSSIVISENISPITVSINQTAEINCFGQKDASLSASISGGKPPFKESWTGAVTSVSSVLQNAGAGKYIYTVTDSQGKSATSEFTIKEPAALSLEILNVTPATSGNEDGKVQIKVAGGTLPYELTSDDEKQEDVKVLTNMKVGNHLIRVIDAKGCVVEKRITISENIQPIVLTIKAEQEIRCGNINEGILIAEVSGGKQPVKYNWSNGQKEATISNLKPDSYSVTITDATGNTAEQAFKLNGPTPLDVKVVNLRSATNDRTMDGKANVEIKGGAGSYKIIWSSGETTEAASKLALGAGNVKITDANGCESTINFTIREKVLPELTAERLASGEPIRMEKIQFAADSTNVNDEAKPSLDEVFDFLYDNPTVIIEVAGHTNGLPADEYCDQISTARAEKVSQYIINKGIDPKRVIAKGYGKRKPIATNQTPEGRKRNQRVEIRLIQIGE